MRKNFAEKHLKTLGYTEEAIARPRVLESPLVPGERIAVGGEIETQPAPPAIPTLIREATQAELRLLKNLGCYEHLIVDLSQETAEADDVSSLTADEPD